MDNIRNVVGCPVAGLTNNELIDGSPAVHQYTEMFVGDKVYTNLPRKFNVTITGCLDNCTHGPTQDISLTPAIKQIDGAPVAGFNVAAGGKQGSGGFRPASPLDVFVTPDQAAEVCSNITLIFRDHGSREARNKSRLAFLVDDWGVERFREEMERRAGHPLLTAGQDQPMAGPTNHIGIFRQKQEGLNYAGLVAPVGRITGDQLLEVARLAETYGNGDIRLTPGQDVIITNIPDGLLEEFQNEPLLESLTCDPVGNHARRGQLHRYRLLPLRPYRYQGNGPQDCHNIRAGPGQSRSHHDALVRLPQRLRQPHCRRYWPAGTKDPGQRSNNRRCGHNPGPKIRPRY